MPDALDPRAPLRHWSTTPTKTDLYVRDWRGTSVAVRELGLHVDKFMVVGDRRSILWPGVWYVQPDWNDASYQRLPWRPITPQERERLCSLCGGSLHAGVALQDIFGGSPDFAGGDVVTLSPTGQSRLTRCMKCSQCGFSRTL